MAKENPHPIVNAIIDFPNDTDSYIRRIDTRALRTHRKTDEEVFLVREIIPGSPSLQRYKLIKNDRNEWYFCIYSAENVELDRISANVEIKEFDDGEYDNLPEELKKLIL